MNRRVIGVFTFALVVAAATSALVYKLIVARVQATPAAKQSIPENRVLVAAHDLQVGALIADEDLKEANWVGPIPEQSVRVRQDLVGRGVIATVYKEEPITEPRLAPKGAGAGLAATIPIGKRAVALRVNEVIGLAGFVLPGMRVDVLIAGNVPGEETIVGTRCKTVLQNIEVLSAGTDIQKDSEGKPLQVRVVNLLVTPEQAEILSLASGLNSGGNQSHIQLALRNPLDTKVAEVPGTAMANLFAGAKMPAKPGSGPRASKPATPPYVIEVVNGSQRSVQQFASSWSQ